MGVALPTMVVDPPLERRRYFEAEAFACALSKVYTFGPTFRAENSNTSRHASEFWMIEPEMAFTDLNGDMDLAEQLVKYLVYAIQSSCHFCMRISLSAFNIPSPRAFCSLALRAAARLCWARRPRTIYGSRSGRKPVRIILNSSLA